MGPTFFKCFLFSKSNSPKITEPFDELCSVIFVELHIREVDFQNGRARIANVEEHQLGFAKMHRCQRAGVQLSLRQ